MKNSRFDFRWCVLARKFPKGADIGEYRLHRSPAAIPVEKRELNPE